jgi:hypothetical protein
MTPTTRPGSVTEARRVAIECARAFQDVFAERMIAGYLLGSLAYGGYAAAVSDIDLAIILTDIRDDDPSAVETTSGILRRKGGLHRKLSVFWGSLPALRQGRDDGRFPALDRLELADHGLLLLGDDAAGEIARPTTGELLLESSRFAITLLATDDVIAEFRHPRRLLEDPVWFTKAVLFPVRFLYTNENTTGRAATNDEAIAWYRTRSEGPAPSLVDLAARVRAGHPLNPTEAIPELATGLLPLYRHYIDSHTCHLRGADAPTDLVTAFAHWRERLA